MSDDLTRQHVARRIDNNRNELAGEAMRLQRAITDFTARIIQGGPYTRDARQIAQDALDLAVKASALDSIVEIASITTEGES